MRTTLKTNHFFMFIFLFLLPVLATAGDWYVVNEQPGSGTINKLTTRDSDFSEFFGVGDNGRFYRGSNSGQYWEFRDTPTSEHLNDVAIFWDGTKDVIIAVGDNGHILRSDDHGESWIVNNSQTNVNLTNVEYDVLNDLIWIGGNNGVVFSDTTTNFNESWDPAPFATNNLNIHEMTADWNGFFIVGSKNDTSFVHEVYPLFLVITSGDTLANIDINSLFYSENKLYLAGNDISNADAVVYSREHVEGLGHPQNLYTGPAGKVTDMDMFSFYGAVEPKQAALIDVWWFSTDKGEIWESRDLGVSFRQVYVDHLNRPLNTLIAEQNGVAEFGQAVVAGFDELVLKYGFDLLYISPFSNDQLNYPVQHIELQFSSIPDEGSLTSEISITSNFSGKVLFVPE